MRRSVPIALSFLLSVPVLAQGAAPPGGAAPVPITAAEVEAAQLEMIQAMIDARKAGRPMNQAMRAHTNTAVRAARRFRGRPLASPEVGLRLFDVFLAGGHPDDAARSALTFLVSVPAGLSAPPASKRDESPAVTRARNPGLC